MYNTSTNTFALLVNPSINFDYFQYAKQKITETTTKFYADSSQTDTCKNLLGIGFELNTYNRIALADELEIEHSDEFKPVKIGLLVFLALDILYFIFLLYSQLMPTSMATILFFIGLTAIIWGYLTIKKFDYFA